MQEFKTYVIDEYRSSVHNMVASEFKFTHNAKVKVDKRSSTNIIVNTIRVNVKLYDAELNTLISKSITFENNVLNKTSKNALVNISAKELENKFNKAFNEIINVLFNEYNEEYEKIQTKIELLRRYCGNECNNITPTEFKGERVQIEDVSNSINNEHKSKVIYDM